jgi:EmrB/QacA subfamily drug resistance transporter
MTSTLKSATRRLPVSPLVLVVCLAQFMVILDVSIVNVALPSIKAGLHFSPTALQWVVNAYTITFAGFLLLGGRAADLLGRRLVFTVGTAAFAICSLACALSNSQATLLGARGLQGLAGALLSPATLAIITTSTQEGAERTRALGAWAAVGGLGASSGALLGGLLTQTLSWPAIFAINVPIGALVVVLGLRLIPIGSPRDLEAERHFDAAGAALATAGLATLSFGIVRTDALGWLSAGVLVPIAAALVMLGAFVYVEARVASRPLMPLAIFRSRQLTWANVIVVLMYAGLFSMFYFLTLYIQQVLGANALVAGVSFLPTTLLVFTGSTQAPRLIARFGLRTTLAGGMLVATVGLLWLTQISVGGNYFVEVLPGMILAGLGMGISLVTGTVAAMQGVAPTQSGLASGLLNTSRLVGGALGLATLATIAQGQTRAHAAAGPVRAAVDGYSLALTIGGLFTLAGAAVALTMLRTRRAAEVPVEAGIGSAGAPATQRRTAALPRLRGIVGGPARPSRRAAVGPARRRRLVNPKGRVRSR